MNFIVILGLLLTLSTLSLAKEDPKGCNKRNFDRKMSNVFGQFGPEEQLFPTNREELKEYCR